MICLCVFLGVNVFLRKIAVAAASRPAVEITQQGETLSIQTSTSVRTTHISFTVGQSFNENTVDGRPCTVPTSPQPLVNPALVLSHVFVQPYWLYLDSSGPWAQISKSTIKEYQLSVLQTVCK